MMVDMLANSVSGSGGTGFVALQMARAYGAAAITTACAPSEADACRGWGATDVVDYHVTTALDSVPDDSAESEPP